MDAAPVPLQQICRFQRADRARADRMVEPERKLRRTQPDTVEFALTACQPLQPMIFAKEAASR